MTPTLSQPLAGSSAPRLRPQGQAAPLFDGKGRVLIVVPAFNEETSLPKLLEALDACRDRLGADVLVIDDHSKDRTREVARRHPGVITASLPVNLGIGGAVQTGFRFARRHGYSFVVQVDGDGQHPPAEIASLLEPLREGAADVVLGSRFLSAGGFRSSAARQAGIRVFELTNLLLIGQRITDSTSGFRAYGRKAIEFLADYYPTDYPEPEAVVLLSRAGFRLREVPVRMQERQGGSSSITSLKAVYYMVKVLLAVFIRAFS